MAYGTEIFPQQNRIFSGRKKRIFNLNPTSEFLMMKTELFKKSNSHTKNNSDG